MRRVALALSAIALWAWFCSLAPHTEIGPVALTTPSAFLYWHLPMFRRTRGSAYAVTAPTPVVATVGVTGFHDREGFAGDVWRWMGSAGSWFIVNTSDHVVSAQVEIDLSAFPRARHVRIHVDHRELAGCSMSALNARSKRSGR